MKLGSKEKELQAKCLALFIKYNSIWKKNGIKKTVI